MLTITTRMMPQLGAVTTRPLQRSCRRGKSMEMPPALIHDDSPVRGTPGKRWLICRLINVFRGSAMDGEGGAFFLTHARRASCRSPFQQRFDS
ncbi:MAG: hypothetical protein KDK91_10995 [Gammaproteobacteria bacterium]|nr:hypothetical protein [Gammaproteobacteria bacterium]